jgi:hypothetical protein
MSVSPRSHSGHTHGAHSGDIANKHNALVHFYLDYTQHMVRFVLNSNGSPQKVAFATLSACIAETKKWMTTNKIKMNEAKTEFLLVFSVVSYEHAANGGFFYNSPVYFGPLPWCWA